MLEESWCWESSSFEFQVSEADVSDLQFVQSGYILKCILSHDITLVSTAVQQLFYDIQLPCVFHICYARLCSLLYHRCYQKIE